VIQGAAARALDLQFYIEAGGQLAPALAAADVLLLQHLQSLFEISKAA